MPPLPPRLQRESWNPRITASPVTAGCVLIYRRKTQDVVAIDYNTYNTAAPAAASEDMFTIEAAPDVAGRISRARASERPRTAVYRSAGGCRRLVLGIRAVWEFAPR